MPSKFRLRRQLYLPRSLKEIYLYPVIVCSLVTLLCLAFQVWSFPRYISFRDIGQVLESRLQSGSEGMQLCDHNLTKHPTSDKLQPVLNATPKHLDMLSQYVVEGGAWSPPNCLSKYRVNLIVAYRNRQAQLDTFLHYFHRFLMRQEIDYRIIIVEQNRENLFNRGKLFNIGFREMEQRYPAHCYVFHDVDLIATNLNNVYACSNQPRHMSSALDAYQFQVPYARNFGGVVALTRHQFQRVNGYSNSFYGWGGEDDEFYFRVRRQSPIIRFENAIAQYMTLNHSHEKPNAAREDTLRNGRYEYLTDGLSSLNYSLLTFQLKPLYTWMLVAV